MMISGKKGGSGHLTVDSQGRVSARDNDDDVLLRKRDRLPAFLQDTGRDARPRFGGLRPQAEADDDGLPVPAFLQDDGRGARPRFDGLLPQAAPAPAPSSSLGRYAAASKHVVSAAPQPAASASALKRLAPKPPYPSPLPPLYSSTRASSTPALTFATSMDRLSFMMAIRPLVLMLGLKLLQATPAMLKWRTRMRGEVRP
jgi:hypothetical protein